MSISRPSDRSWVGALGEAGWGLVADRLLHGACHALNGRATSLSGLLYLLESGNRDPSDLHSVFEPEVALLEEVIGLLRLLPDDGVGPEIIVPQEVLPFLSTALSYQRGLETMELRLHTSPDIPAVRCDPTLLHRSLLLLVTRVAELGKTRGAEGVRVTAGDEGGGLLLSFESVGGVESVEGAGSTSLSLVPLPEELDEVLGRVLDDWGVALESGEEEEAVYRLLFPPP